MGANKKPRVKTQGFGIKSCVKSVRVYPSPKPELIMIAMIMVDDTQLNMRLFNTTSGLMSQACLRESHPFMLVSCEPVGAKTSLFDEYFPPHEFSFAPRGSLLFPSSRQFWMGHYVQLLANAPHPD